MHSAALEEAGHAYRRMIAGCTGSPGWTCSFHPDGAVEWCLIAPAAGSLPTSGWKLHLSIAVADARRLGEVICGLTDLGIAFKLPSTLAAIMRINAGEAGTAIIGKVLTAYPGTSVLSDAVQTLLALRLPANGPALIDDLALEQRPDAPIGLRFGAFDIVPVIDRYGRYEPGMLTPAGERVLDDRTGGSAPSWAPPCPVPTIPAPDCQPLDALHRHGLVPLLQLSDSYKSQVWLVAEQASADVAVAKVIRRGLFGDVFGRDAGTRLANERRILEHLNGSNLAPRLVWVEKSDSDILFLEDIDGTSLDRLEPDEALALLPTVAIALAELHQRGVVHRDLKSSNIIAAADGIRLLDFELAAFAGDPLPLIGGTAGFIPDGDEAPVREATDIYALGACLAGLLLRRSPSLLPPDGELLASLVGEAAGPSAEQLVTRLLQPNPNCRPTASQAAEMIATFLLTARPAPDLVRHPEPAPISEYVGGLPNALDPYFVQGSWRNAHSHHQFRCEEINIGSAGIALGLLILRKTHETRHLDDHIVATLGTLASSKGTNVAFGFLSGDAGAVLPLRIGASVYGNESLARSAHRRLARSAEGVEENDLFAGRAGLLLLCSLLYRWSPDRSVARIGKQLARGLITESSVQQSLLVWPSRVPLDGDPDPYLGAAHGSSGIAAALGLWGRVAGDRDAARLAQDAFARLARHGSDVNGLRSRATPGSYSAPSNEWCHGTAGLAWSLLMSGLDHRDIADELLWSVASMSQQPELNNATMCHGMAGMVETWRLVQAVPEFAGEATRALRRHRRLLMLTGRSEGALTWSSEHPGITTPDLWIGFLGPYCQLALLERGALGSMLDPAMAA
jgi:predicted Ser/Thr protein kinase